MNEGGVEYKNVKLGDRIYLVGDINELLSKKQDLLTPGTGIEITDNGEIRLASIPKQEVKCTAECKDLTESMLSSGGDLVFEEAYRFYRVTVSTTSVQVLRPAGCLLGLQTGSLAEVQLFVTFTSAGGGVSFESSLPIKKIGDTDYSAIQAQQTVVFGIRSYLGTITISKLS